MQKNPFQKFVNHKLLHKIGKQWTVISVGLLLLLSGTGVITHPIHASQFQKEPITQQIQKKSNLRKVNIKQNPVSIIHHSNNNSMLKHGTVAKQININQRAQRLHTRIINHNAKRILVPSASRHNHRHYHKHYRRHGYHHSRTRKMYYVTPDHHHRIYYFTPSDMEYMKKNTDDDYKDNMLSISDVKTSYKTPIHHTWHLQGYHFDKVNIPFAGQEWVLRDQIDRKRTYKHTDKPITKLLHHLDNKFLNKYYSNKSIHQIKVMRHRYNYLIKYENNSDNHNLNNYRKETIDWINFYRNNIYELSDVTENASYDAKAQEGASRNQDPEDMDWGSSTPEEAVNDYFTDANDVDNDHETGHRYSILNPKANQIGVGHHGDRNTLFFDWGFNGNDDYENVDYPRIGEFPITDAQNGEYWSYEMDTSPSDVTVSVYDETAHKWLKVSHLYLYNNIAYYRVPTSKIKNHHMYKIITQETINGQRQGKDWYETQFFNL